MLGGVFKRLQKRLIIGLALGAILFNAVSPGFSWAFVADDNNQVSNVIWMASNSSEAEFEFISGLPEFEQWVEVCTTQHKQWWALDHNGKVIAKSNHRPAHVPPYLFQLGHCEYCSHTIKAFSINPLYRQDGFLRAVSPHLIWPSDAFQEKYKHFYWHRQAARAPPTSLKIVG